MDRKLNSEANAAPASTAGLSVDALVVGAGFAGIYSLFRLREMGMRTQLVEAGSSVGGTWYWNRYPGARCDTKSLGYCFSFSEDMWLEWDWSEAYASQPEIERYMNYVVDRLQLRDHMAFDERVTSAVFDESARRWNVETATGARYTAKFLIMGTGGFSAPVVPDIDGLQDFDGEVYFTANWPSDPVSFAGKRVGVIGTGSSGMQAITYIGQEDVEDELVVFQRTASYAVPGRNKPLADQEQRRIKSDYRGFWDMVHSSGTGFIVDVPVGPAAGLSEEQFTERMDAAYASGGPTVLGWISDLQTDEEVNRRAAEYLRRKVDERVNDPKTADLLKARGHFVGSRRQLIENGYFEVFNSPKVSLVDVSVDPIVRFTPDGLETRDGTYKLDVLVLATGFDSGTGALLRAGVVGEGQRALADKWVNGPSTYLGIMTAGFPNLFIIAGPGSPSIRSVVSGSIEHHVDWMVALLTYMADVGADEVDPLEAAEEAWTDHAASVVDKLLLGRDLDTPYWGANVPGKPRVYLAYVGGVQPYRRICAAVANDGYDGFLLRDRGRPLPRANVWAGIPNLSETSAAPLLGGSVI
jgi:cyclohexanone monooxygenase